MYQSVKTRKECGKVDRRPAQWSLSLKSKTKSWAGGDSTPREAAADPLL